MVVADKPVAGVCPPRSSRAGASLALGTPHRPRPTPSPSRAWSPSGRTRGSLAGCGPGVAGPHRRPRRLRAGHCTRGCGPAKAAKPAHGAARQGESLAATEVQAQERSPMDNLDMKETGTGGWGGQLHNQSFYACHVITWHHIMFLTIIATGTLHGTGKLADSSFVIIAQS